MLSNAIRAEKAIAEMPFGSWIDIRNLSKEAQLSIYILSRYLTQERRKGLVERKLLPNGYGKMHLWRRIN
jgi:hypothetical protein